jgi:N,N-dimethylformamidase
VNYPHVVEEVMFAFPGMDGTQDPRSGRTSSTSQHQTTERSLAPAPSPGAGSLSHDGYDNNVSRITANVLRAFANEERLP